MPEYTHLNMTSSVTTTARSVWPSVLMVHRHTASGQLTLVSGSVTTVKYSDAEAAVSWAATVETVRFSNVW